MKNPKTANVAADLERKRILDEYCRRYREVSPDLYAPWNPSAVFIRDGCRREAALLLKREGVFPAEGDRCCEIGYGTLGWLDALIGWGLRESDVHGIELDEKRAVVAKAALPGADLRVGDAAEMPWEDGAFKLIIASTVFSSILDASVRVAIAAEIRRCLAPGGAFLWYDFVYDNPTNPNVKGIREGEIRRLFPGLSGPTEKVTLAPPIVRTIVPISRPLATLLEAVPILRTHLVGVFVKKG